jgi:hypothetical protein
LIQVSRSSLSRRRTTPERARTLAPI